MKKGRKFFVLLLLCLLISIIVMPVSASATVKLNKKKVTLQVNEEIVLKMLYDNGATVSGVKWTSSNQKVVKVSANGKISAIGVGTCKVTAKAKDISKSCTVVVKKKKPTAEEKNWYKEVLMNRNKIYYEKNTWGGKKEYGTISEFVRYCLLDINGDGIKELLLQNWGAGANWLILGYSKNKVTPLYYGRMIRFSGIVGNKVVFSMGSSTASTFYVYQLKNNKMKEVVNFFWTTSSAVPLFYKVNGKKCSKAVFDAHYNKYVKNAKTFDKYMKDL